jgi:8-oxo-dGTP pyrophosphatase MutT (NUDIX family)
MRDKRRVKAGPGIERQLRFVPPTTVVPFEAVTAVCVIPFLRSGEVVGIIERRGLDIPGGHVQDGETSIVAVGRREALEEAAITLGDLNLIGYLASPIKDEVNGTTYIAILTGLTLAVLPFTSRYDANDRRIVNPDRFLADYRGGDSKTMRMLLDRARQVLFHLGSSVSDRGT